MEIRHHTGTAMRIVRLRHADCRQLHQRPLRLSERQRPCRPPRPRTRLCTRLDYPHSHETGNSRNAYILLPHGLRPAATMLGTLTPRRLGTDTVRAALRNIRILIYHILSYQGWGDLLVLVFFGFIPVGGTYYVQAHIITADVWVASLICGLVIDTLLVVNNYRDREQDALSGKRTLIVRFGEPFGRYLYLGLGIATALLSLWFVYNDKIEPLAFIWAPCVYLYLHVLTWRKMAAIRSGKN